MKKRIDRIGETTIARNGQRMTDVLFDNGYIATHKRYANFKSGRIAKGEVSADV